MMMRAVVRAVRPMVTSRLPSGAPVVQAVRGSLQMRQVTTIKIMDDAAKAAETLYWAAEDERLLKKMLESHPELDPKYQGIQNIMEEGDVVSKVKMIFMKHGIPPANKALISDIVSLVEKS
mmetsp:Transcript_563/g.348  ORF Transcript_563/g.348 Transcript_563/m.348 type:complete len:121 (-) Transcript_563:132-494(-)